MEKMASAKNWNINPFTRHKSWWSCFLAAAADDEWGRTQKNERPEKFCYLFFCIKASGNQKLHWIMNKLGDSTYVLVCVCSPLRIDGTGSSRDAAILFMFIQKITHFIHATILQEKLTFPFFYFVLWLQNPVIEFACSSLDKKRTGFY